MPRSSSPPWLITNNIWWSVQVTKFLIMQSSPFSDVFNLCSSLNVRSQISQSYRKAGRIMILYILSFEFLDGSQEDKRF
jgi:hypothetical protein